MHEIFDAPEWFEALSLVERAALPNPDPGAGFSAERTERAARKADRWRREAELLDDPLFGERLALDGLTPDCFLRILATPAAELRRRVTGRPAWLDELAQAFSAPAFPLPETLGTGDLGVLELLRPLIAGSYAGVLTGLRRISTGAPEILDPEAVAASLLATLIRRLRWASERALALELQASRLEGKLAGETPEERFRSFVEALRQPAAALEILRRYPVLARDACRHARQWVATSLEMMERFAADRGEIVRLVADRAEPGPVVAAESGLSDRHAGGRSVAILGFASGLRIVYKPKPLTVDLHFQALVAWLNDRGAEPPLRRLAVLDRGGYGWVEHVSQRSCDTAAEAERFHARQGAWAALFYVLEATDFHHENLIAEGEHPVPIDLETLFQPARAERSESGPGHLPTEHTVLNSGLLPRRFWSTAEQSGLDLSGMGALGGQKVEVRRITGEGTDRMCWSRQETKLAVGPNIPTLRGETLSLWEHDESVLRGFRTMYRQLLGLRDELLAPHGPLSAFAALPVRALLRGTAVYAHLLHVACHPDYLRSALDRDRLWDRLWLDAAQYLPFRRVVQAERDDLAAGDVPFFATRPATADLLHPRLAEGRSAGFFAASGLDLVRDRLRAMGEDDLERQSWLVQASIEATRSLDERFAWSSTGLPETAVAGPDRFLAAAQKIGDRLAQLAIEQGESVSWFQLDLRPEGWRLEPMPVNLYSGLAGIALFLAHLGRLSGEESHQSLARRALDTVRRRVEAEPATLVHVGGFSGWGGLVYAFTHLGQLWGEPGLLAEAEVLAKNMPGIEEDAAFDLIAGSAGALAALLALYRHRPTEEVLATAIRCGERLLAGATPGERGHGWPPFDAMGRVPLTGFSHGTAGIAWALARLAQISGDPRFSDAARSALRYERSWFCPERDNWLDLRESHRAPGASFLWAWCHGAPGIGLGRLATLPYLADPQMLPEIRAAVRSTLAEGFGGNHSLCHGDLGNLELLREAGRALDDAALTEEAGRLASRILARIETEGPRCGTSARTENLGLMVGLAGIGYGLLRAAWPERVPSVLLLETPAG